MRARANNSQFFLLAALVACALLQYVSAVDQLKIWTVTGSGSSALRDYVSDGVNNATQDADLGGLYLPFYTEGTGVGQSRFVDSSVDYTIGDYQLSTSSYQALGRPIVQFPIALGAVALYHNITNYTSPNTLRLNSSVIAGIFTANITTWDDPQILELNPNLTAIGLLHMGRLKIKLQGQGIMGVLDFIINLYRKLSPPIAGKNITVIVRTDSVAAGQAFSKYLNVTVPNLWGLGVNSTIPWKLNLPNWKYTIGGSNLTAAVAANPYSIAFSDAYAGKKAKLTDAALQNKNKDWVKYTQAWWNFTSLGNDTIIWPNSPGDNWSNFSIINLGGNKTYPIPTAAFAASNTDLRDKEDRGAAQKQTFGYLLGPSVAKRASAYQEFPLPPAFLNYSIWATSLIKVRSSKVFFEPYQLASVGPPYSVAFRTQ